MRVVVTKRHGGAMTSALVLDTVRLALVFVDPILGVIIGTF